VRRWAAAGGLLVTALVVSQSGIATATSTQRQVAQFQSRSAVRGDFDGDGRSDLVALMANAGARIDYTKAHPGGHHVQLLRPHVSHAGWFTAVAVGDFNGDGFADLALGAPDYSHNDDETEQGAVFIYYGSAHGLRSTAAVFTGPNDFDNDNELGSSVAAGDVNGDGYDDLAVGNPGPAGGGDSQGSVRLYYGSASGLTATGAQGIASLRPVDEGEFGSAVTLADVNGDGHDDLVVGEPGGHAGPQNFATAEPGDIQVFDGTHTGVGSAHRLITAASVGAAGSFGSALASGDIDGKAPADVVASAPKATVDARPEAGRIVVLRGGSSGLSPTRHQTVGARFTHLKQSSQGHAWFGTALAVGDVTGGGKSDVIVGAPPASAPHTNFGAVYVLHGSAHGVTASGAQRLTQASVGNPGSTPRASFFGQSLAVLVTGRGPRREVAIGLPGANFGGHHDQKGAVVVLRGTAKGLSTHHVRLIKGTRVLGQLGVGLGS
jgi:hypothetical protein